MRYKSYVVTCIGETKKVNNDNFFLNGFCKDGLDDSFIFERNKEFRSRNLYALASGAKCDVAGDELSYIVIDILKNFHVADFDSVNREFFHVANTAVTSQVLDRSNEHYEVDMSILSVDRDVATVYNMGDIPVYCYEDGKLENLAGKAPEMIDVAKDYVDNKGEIQTKYYTIKNVPYIGTLSSDMEVVPYTSVRKKIRKRTYFLMCTRDVLKVLDEKTIEDVLADKNIKDKHKALALLDKAVRKDSEGNYSIEVIVATHGLAIAEKELKSLGKWVVVAGVCLGLCFNGDYLLSSLSDFVDGCKALVQKFSSEDEVEAGKDLKWTPLNQEETEDEEDDKKIQEEEEIPLQSQSTGVTANSSNVPAVSGETDETNADASATTAGSDAESGSSNNSQASSVSANTSGITNDGNSRSNGGTSGQTSSKSSGTSATKGQNSSSNNAESEKKQTEQKADSVASSGTETVQSSGEAGKNGEQALSKESSSSTPVESSGAEVAVSENELPIVFD